MDAELQALLDRVGQKMVRKEPETAPEAATAPEERIGAQMAFWPEECAAMPTELTRVSLFGLIRRGRRKVLDWEKLASRADIEVSYFGKQLDQADADLWLACLRMGRGLPMGQRIYTTRAALLKEIGRCDGTSDRKWLDSALDRFAGAAIRIVIKRGGKTVTLRCKLMGSGIEEASGEMFIRLDPDGAALFENLAYIGWEQRLTLNTNAAKALQLYVSGHMTGKPHAVPLADLAHWMGYEGRIRDFRATLRHAMTELESSGLIASPVIKSSPRGDIAAWVRTGKATDPPPALDA